MIARRANQGSRAHSRTALTLVESIVSIPIVGIMLVAALNTVGASKLGAKQNVDRGSGMLLADQLMSEILTRSYEEPVDAVAFGIEFPELGTTRAAYDDVDDYHNWSASPPQYKDGTGMSNLTTWRRTSMVRWVDPNDVTQTRVTDTGVKEIVVTVTRNDLTVASLTAIRTWARDNMESK